MSKIIQAVKTVHANFDELDKKISELCRVHQRKVVKLEKTKAEGDKKKTDVEESSKESDDEASGNNKSQESKAAASESLEGGNGEASDNTSSQDDDVDNRTLMGARCGTLAGSKMSDENRATLYECSTAISFINFQSCLILKRWILVTVSSNGDLTKVYEKDTVNVILRFVRHYS
jgi:hypothetical protein